MKYEIINPDEKLEDTVKLLDFKWNAHSQNERENKRHLKVEECKIYMRGQVWIIEHEDMILYYESHNENYPFFEMACHYIDFDNPCKWKTVDKILSLRMGIRQTEVNWCGYVENMLEGKKMTLNRYTKFMEMARAQDLQHHGVQTF